MRKQDVVLHEQNCDVYLTKHNVAYPASRVTCQHCHVTFSCPSALSGHRNACSLHMRLDIDRIQVETHNSKETPTKSQRQEFSCKQCPMTLSSQEEYYKHMETVHKQNYLDCQYCEKKLKSQFNLRQHFLTKHNQESLYECEICEEKFKLSRYLISHIKKSHPESIDSPKSKTATPSEFKCELCGKVLTTRYNLKSHVRVVHLGMTHTYQYEPGGVCDVCGEYKKQLWQHKRTHSTVRRYACPHCDKAFKKKNQLDTHIRVHTGEKPYVCDVCGRGFKQSNDMWKHRRNVHGLDKHTRSASDAVVKSDVEVVPQD
uniref:Zinc finger protein 287 n=1 Tax=Cacopsylla melanoneura TaxID=428564 RepID=A0A8D8YS89_9HEMI